ncbi:MAG: FAD-binding and (Fe-S)-binding domain-containing protein [Pseudomonadota bacterium]|nr:FAD-binding and (Fe-S)-binding domain-containing protein [Pseudomonadota bacterium]
MDGGITKPKSARIGDAGLARRLSRELAGDVWFDAHARGRYSTDASIYQIEPIGVVAPRTVDDISAVIDIAREEGVPLLPRGGGTSQCGQAVGEALVLDTSNYLNQVIDFDADAGIVSVEPGLVLDHLNAWLRPHGVFFPVDPSTSAQCTLGGMTANNSAGARSLRYGIMVDNVTAIDAILADGARQRFAETPADVSGLEGSYGKLVGSIRDMARREADEIINRIPKLLRKVGGYNIDTISAQGHNMAKLLVGSEGTLGFFHRIELKVQPLPKHRVLGICHFERFRDAMEMSRHIVTLDPSAVELMDRTMMGLGRDIPVYRAIVERFVRGDPEAVLMVEFAGDTQDEQIRRLGELSELMADHGYPGAVLDAVDPAFQRDIVEVRKAGLNIMMSMKGDGKPVSFIEDCAVPLEDLADYTSRLTEVFTRNGVAGTWYAHASVGCLHVRPVLNMKDQGDVTKMRAIAEEAFAMVREYKGSHSGEHGDGISRSEFLAPMYGKRITDAFKEVKRAFDPEGLFNPGKIVDPPRFDDRSLFRFKPEYAPSQIDTAFDWSPWGGFSGAAEMCNNNGECRKRDANVMCPSYRATGDEQHVTRGRANSLRLALSGQLGEDALTSDELAATMELCIGCKGCKRECPTGIDMARMKTEFLYQRQKTRNISLRERLISDLPRYAPWAARIGPVLNLRDKIPGLAGLSETVTGFSARRKLPQWRRDAFRAPTTSGTGQAGEVVLFADTFNSWFEPENARAAQRVLETAGYKVHAAQPDNGNRSICCGRTYLAAGRIDEARKEARRSLAALRPFLRAGMPVIGLEPSCLLTFRDEYKALDLGADADLLAETAVLFQEFLVAERGAGRLALDLGPISWKKALVHGHCHEKAFAVTGAIASALAMIPELDVEIANTGCCGMAGPFGYEADHYELSVKMAELDVLPTVRESDDETVIIANGTSCRQQISDGAGRQPYHIARLFEAAINSRKT